MKVRWGILGTADIARKNWLAILNSGNSVVVAVGSRQRERAQRFIRECQIHAPMPELPLAFGSYEELIASNAVDAVYLPLPTALRKEWVLRAAAAGKHVVCEKPCAVSVGELQEMLEACRQNGVQFMDGVMFVHSRRLGSMRATLDDRQPIGSIRRIASAFTFAAPPEFFAENIRADPALEPQGCLGDLGWYCIRFSLWAMGWQMPKRVIGRILAERPARSGSVLAEFSGELLFQEGVSDGFFCSFLTQNQQWAQVSGSNGYLRLEDFVVPFDGPKIFFETNQHQFRKSGCEFKMDPRITRFTLPEHSQAHPSAQESNLFRNFAAQTGSGRLNEQWPQWAFKTQVVMEACLASARQDSRPVTMGQ